VADETREERSRRLTESMVAARDGEMYEEWAWAAEQDPDFVEIYANFTNALRGGQLERSIPTKYHELFYIVVLANRGFFWTLSSHMRRALKQGATKQEILEALELAVTPGGAPVMHLGLRALMERSYLWSIGFGLPGLGGTLRVEAGMLDRTPAATLADPRHLGRIAHVPRSGRARRSLPGESTR
jgi:alkylhydroperoxidase/carboxymuconolactone decarboxylase family protein YurZ